MQFEIAPPSCPLCKRQVPANSPEHTLSTRLCEQCQTMVLTAFRGGDSMVAGSAAVVPQRCAPAQVQHDAPAVDNTMVGTASLFEGNPADPGAFECEQSPIPFEAPDEVRFDFYNDEDPEDRIQRVGADSYASSEDGPSRHRGDLSEGFVQSIRTTDHDYEGADDSQLTGQPSAFTEAAVDSARTGASLEDRFEDPPSIGDEAVTDPWEAALPVWDYSHSEWPLLVGPSKQGSFGRMRYTIAAVVFVAGAIGFYLLIYRPSIPVRRTATESGTTARLSAAEPRAAAVGSADSAAREQAAAIPSGTPAGAASPPVETVAREAVASHDNSVQGGFSLQAAAFATQGGADEFAERLKRAGVPSYVVPADVARRGRWFRVRVGRFNSTEEAQAFAGEAQQRARAAGLAVQLIVCRYDQP